MSTNKEQTLQINKFLGVNRHSAGAERKIGEFQSLINMAVPDSGSLEFRGGTQSLGDSFAGVSEIVHANWLNNESTMRRGLVCYYKTSVTSIPAPNALSYTTLGAPTTVRKVKTVFVGPGGVRKVTETTGVQFGASGISAALPANVPAYIFCIHFYVSTGTDSGQDVYLWGGSLTRKNGSFASAVGIPDPPATNVSSTYTAQPTSFNIVPTTGGSLIPGTTYYFAVTPWISMGANVVSTTDASNRTMAYTLPEGFNAISISLNGMPATTGSPAAAYSYVALFMGVNARDLLPVGEMSDGSVAPITKTGTTVLDLPYNSSLSPSETHIEYSSPDYTYVYLSNAVVGDNDPDLLFAVLSLGSAALSDVAPSENWLGAFYLPDGVWNDSTRIELLHNYDIRSISLESFQLVVFSSLSPQAVHTFFASDETYGYPVFTANFGGRQYAVNGWNTPFRTNGIVWRPLVRPSNGSEVRAIIPIARFIKVLKDRMILGGGPNNFTYSAGSIYYSASGDPSNYGGTTGAASTQGFKVGLTDDTDIVGLEVLSQNLAVDGPQAYLIIGRKDSVWSWNADVSSPQVIQLEKSSGFAGPKCYANTRFGGMYVGRDNVYLVRSADSVVPFGYEFQDVIKAMSQSVLQGVSAIWHDDTFKVAYKDPLETRPYMNEIWWKLIQGEGGVEKYASGPHAGQDYNDHGTIQGSDYLRDYRYAVRGAKVLRVDDRTSLVWDGATMTKGINIQWAGLGADDFWKVITQLYMYVDVAAVATTFNVQFTDDQFNSYSFTIASADHPGTSKKFIQHMIAQRDLRRIMGLTISTTTNVDLQVYELSVLFETQRRRRLNTT